MSDTAQNAGDVPGTGSESDANPSLDTLTAEWEKGRTEAPAASDPAVTKLLERVDKIAAHQESQIEKEKATELETFINQSVGFLKEDEILKEVDDEIAEGFLTARYNRDAAFKQACDKRAENPEAWQSALETARSSLAERYPGGTVRSDIEAAKASISGSTSEAPEETPDEENPQKLFEMNDVEFRRYKENLTRGAGSA